MNEDLVSIEEINEAPQETCGILTEVMNYTNLGEFNTEGLAPTEVVRDLLIKINSGECSIHILPIEEIPNTYKVIYAGINNNGVAGGHIYVNEHFKNIISEAWDSKNENNTQEASEENSLELSEEEQELLDRIVEEAHQEIPPNSATLLTDVTTSRFSSAIWYENIQKKVIVLAGAGGIGSYVGFLLARMKPTSLFIYDDDVVETVNMSGQLYGQGDIGAFKVDALARMIRNYASYNSIFAIPEKFTSSSEATNIMICGFDNMEAREIFFEKWLNHVASKTEDKRANCLFIDGRLAAEEFQVFCIKGDDEFNINRYRSEFLFSDIEAEETICSYKQTSFCANMIASYIVNLFVNFCANQCEPLIDRDLPFLTIYNAETMYLKTEA